MFYSKSTGGFYDAAIHGDNIPSDAVGITDVEHQSMLDGQSQGKRIMADTSGHPMLTDPPPPTLDQVRTTRTAEIKAALAEIDAKSIRPLRDGDTVRLADLEMQAVALRQELAAL